MLLSVDCDVMLDNKGMNFFVNRLGASFRLSLKRFCHVKKSKFLKLSLIMTHDDVTITLYETHSKVVINRAKFDVCTSSSYGGIKAHVHTYRQNRTLCILDFHWQLIRGRLYCSDPLSK